MNSEKKTEIQQENPVDPPESGTDKNKGTPPQVQREVGGPRGPEPTRYGDWEKGGRCIDF